MRAWQSAYRGIVPDDYLDALEVDSRRERWRARLAGGDCTFVVDEHGIAGYCRVVPPERFAGSTSSRNAGAAGSAARC